MRPMKNHLRYALCVQAHANELTGVHARENRQQRQRRCAGGSELEVPGPRETNRERQHRDPEDQSHRLNQRFPLQAQRTGSRTRAPDGDASRAVDDPGRDADDG